jgi:multiple sugar transport system permease protein
VALPIAAYEALFILYPILQEVYTGFTNIRVLGKPAPWVGLANYRRMFFDDPNFWLVMRNTAVYVVGVVITAVAVGLFTALLLNRNFIGRGLARTMLTVPWAFPDVAAVLAFIWIFNPTFGVANVFVRLIPGLTENPKWLLDGHLAMPTVIGISAWKGFPFYSLVILAALQAIPLELYEAARVDGANAVQSFRYVTLPGIRPTLLLMVVLATIFAFRQFTLIWLTTGGGPGQATETLVVRIYSTAFRFVDLSYGAALGVIGFVCAFIVTTVFMVLQRQLAQGA